MTNDSAENAAQEGAREALTQNETTDMEQSENGAETEKEAKTAPENPTTRERTILTP